MEILYLVDTRRVCNSDTVVHSMKGAAIMNDFAIRIRLSQLPLLPLVAALFFGTLAAAPAQSVINKAWNNTVLTNASSWAGGVVPGPSDIQQWDNPPIANGTGPNLGGNLTNGQLRILNPVNNMSIGSTAGATLTLNGVAGRGVDMRAGGVSFTLNCNLALGGPQIWDINNNLAVPAALNNNGYALKVVNWAGTPTLASQISGAGSLAWQYAYGATLTLSSTNTYTGNTTLYGGTMLLDFSAAAAPANNIINNTANSSTLVLEGNGTLSVKGKAGATILQQFNGLNLNHGGAVIVNNNNSAANLTIALGAIAQGNNASVDFQPTGATGTITTTTASLGPWATVGGASDFATNVSGVITGLNAPVTAETGWSGGDYSLNNSGTVLTLTGARSANTLRNVYNNGPSTVDVANVTLTLNGLLNGQATWASNPTLTIKSTGTGSLVIGPSGNLHVGGAGNTSGTTILTIAAPITGSGNLIKIGTDYMNLSANNTFTGTFVLNAGQLVSNQPLPFGATNNTIVLQGGTFGTFNGGARFAQYRGMVWAGDFLFADGVNSRLYLDLNGTPATLSNGTRIVSINYTSPGLFMDGVISDGGNNYGLTLCGGSGGDLFLFGKNTYTGPTTVWGDGAHYALVFADKGQALLNNNFVLQGGLIGPAFNPDYGLTLGSGAGQVQFCPGVSAGFAANPYSYAVVNLNNGATLIQNSTPYFLLGGTTKTLNLFSYNNHAVVWRNPIQLTSSGGVPTTLTVAGNGGFPPGQLPIPTRAL